MNLFVSFAFNVNKLRKIVLLKKLFLTVSGDIIPFLEKRVKKEFTL